ELIQIASLRFCRPAYLAQALAGIEAGTFRFWRVAVLFRSEIVVMVNSLGIRFPVVQQSFYYNNPFPVRGFYFVGFSYMDLFRCLYIGAIAFYTAAIAGLGRQSPGFEYTDGPEIFVDSEFFGSAHFKINFLSL